MKHEKYLCLQREINPALADVERYHPGTGIARLGSFCVIHVSVYMVDIVLSGSRELIVNQVVHLSARGNQRDTVSAEMNYPTADWKGKQKVLIARSEAT